MPGSRKAVGESDFTRQARQQQILLALRNPGDAGGSLLFKLPDLLDAVGDTIRSDVPVDQLPALAAIMEEVGRDGVTSVVIRSPLVHPKKTSFGDSQAPDLTAIRAMAARLFSGARRGARSVADPEADQGPQGDRGPEGQPRERRSVAPIRPRPGAQNPSASSLGVIRRAARARCEIAFFSAGRPQAERPAAGRLRRRLEDRVVAEPAGPQRARRDPAAAGAAGQAEADAAARTRVAGECQGEHAHVARAAPLGRQPGERRQELRVVVVVRGVLAGVASRPDAGRPAQGVDLDARIVGQRRQTAGPQPEARLDRGVRLERRAVLDRIALDPELVERDELGMVERQQLAQLAQLVDRARGDEQARSASPPDGGEDGGLGLEQLRQPAVGEVEQAVRGGPVERLALGRPLQLDVARRHRCRRR